MPIRNTCASFKKGVKDDYGIDPDTLENYIYIGFETMRDGSTYITDSKLENMRKTYRFDEASIQDGEDKFRCPCGQVIKKLCYIIDKDDLKKGTGEAVAIGSECIRHFTQIEMKKRCLRCNEIYSGKYENCRTCREEMDKIKQEQEREKETPLRPRPWAPDPAYYDKWDCVAKRWVRKFVGGK